jgi:hypothetical protein
LNVSRQAVIKTLVWQALDMAVAERKAMKRLGLRNPCRDSHPG